MKKNSGLIAVFSLMLACGSGYAQDTSNDLLKEFETPPNSAKPRIWWHWMNGNISKDGIYKDLLWMDRIGLGGFMNFDAALATPQIVKKRLTYMTPEWKDAFLLSTKLADSLKLEMAIAGSPGWSETGGPWVLPKDGMKKVVWSETRVKGGKTFKGVLSKPPTASGVFQNLKLSIHVGIEVMPVSPEYYQDISVLAYRLPSGDILINQLNPTVTSSGGNFNLTQLTDGDLNVTNMLPSDQTRGYAWIQYEFKQPQEIKAITILGGGDKGPWNLYGDLEESRSLEVSDDGKNFKRIVYIPAGGLVQQTVNIPVTTAKFYRIIFKNLPTLPFLSIEKIGEKNTIPPVGTEISEIVLHTTTYIDRFEDKAAFARNTNLYNNPTTSTNDKIDPNDVIDLTSKMKADGTLNWIPPAGNWNIVRFGFSLTGKVNHPAPPEATGLEVDKLNPIAVKAYWKNYLDQYKSATGGLMGAKGGLQYIMVDSWEAGTQNWTDNLPAEFAKRRGYSLLPWMPVLTGRIIKSSEESEKFLWDYRKTLSEMLAEYHYDQLTTILKERGMKHYAESHEKSRALIADGMDVKRAADIPMSAMWTQGGPVIRPETNYIADIRESASVAHIYGQNLVAAESLTAMGNAWAFSPERLKPTADLELASGLNRFVIHSMVHQPSDDHIPGLGLGVYGQWFNRHETWAEQAKPWIGYLARSSYLLQQGKFVADIIYYYGEDNNITSLFGKKSPNIPQGYNFDYVNADALLNLLSVKNGQIVTPSGMHYKVLALDANSQQMTLKVANKISELVKSGAIVVGPKPTGTPSLTDDLTSFNTVVNELWGADNTVKPIGSGKVYTGESIEKVLAALDVKPDFEYTKPRADTQLLYVHRELPEQELYWVNNRNDRTENLEATFRVSGKTVEIWHPETGKTEPASYSFADGRTKVALHLAPNDAVFVVFKDNTTTTAQILPAVTETKLAAVEGNWNLSFQKERGAPSEITMDKLTSWTENSDLGVKYFSGTGAYSKTIDAPKSWFKNQGQLWIDLGEVKNLAEVIVNGKSLGIVWKKPFRVDATGILKPGKNTLVIKVTNLWVNRLIGDEQPGVLKKITYTTMPFYKADAPLLPSGLLSTVTVLSVK